MLQRFFNKVKVSVNRSYNGTPCLEWQASKFWDGYGKFPWNGKTVRTHRLVWEQAVGPIPKGMCICHHCDNRPCINLMHLFLGTQADNLKDMREKGRQASGDKHGSHIHPETIPRGEQHHCCKLTDAQVHEIRSLYVPRSKEFNLYSLARHFGVGHVRIWQIVKGSRTH